VSVGVVDDERRRRDELKTGATRLRIAGHDLDRRRLGWRGGVFGTSGNCSERFTVVSSRVVVVITSAARDLFFSGASRAGPSVAVLPRDDGLFAPV
jgi:hypothetical protein